LHAFYETTPDRSALSVHFRDVDGIVPRFNETFIDQENYDAYEILSLLDEVRFEEMIIPDHVPHVEGDSDWNTEAALTPSAI
jgi:D-mannonate dehydratase